MVGGDGEVAAGAGALCAGMDLFASAGEVWAGELWAGRFCAGACASARTLHSAKAKKTACPTTLTMLANV